MSGDPSPPSDGTRDLLLRVLDIVAPSTAIVAVVATSSNPIPIWAVGLGAMAVMNLVLSTYRHHEVLRAVADDE
jgi:hypothetical protein